MWIAIEGGAILLRLSVRQGGFNIHTRLQNKDLLARIRYSSIPESSDRITWIPGRVRKGDFPLFIFSLCMYD